MEIKRSGSQPSVKGAAEYFTGTVRVDPLFNPSTPARAFGASVTFEPGARTAWHTHPLGQTPICDGWLWPSTALGRPDRGNSSRVTSSGFRLVRSIGTAPLQPRR